MNGIASLCVMLKYALKIIQRKNKHPHHIHISLIVPFLCVSAPIQVFSSPSEISCGSIPIGESKTCYISINSAGNYTISITQPQNVFSLASAIISAPTNVPILFTPSSQGLYFGVIEITKNSSNQKTSIFIKGECFSWEKIELKDQMKDLGYVFRHSNPEIQFEIRNNLKLGTVYIIDKTYLCNLTYILPGDEVRCSTHLNYTDERKGSFSKSFKINIEVEGYQHTLTLHVAGILAYPEVQIEDKIHFGGVLVGREKTNFLKILNKGNFPLIISDAICEPPFFLSEVPKTVESIAFVPVTFRPNSSDIFSRRITFLTNIGFISIEANGYGVSSPFPTLFLERATVDFGTLVVGESKREKLLILNTGAENLIIKDVYIPQNPAFYLKKISLPLILKPMESTALEVIFEPRSEGEFLSYIELESNDTEMAKSRVQLFAKSYNPDVAATTNIDFGHVRVGQAKKKNIILANEKPFPFVISAIHFESSKNFRYEQTFALPVMLKYGDAISIPVIFYPSELTHYETQVTFLVILPSSSNYSFRELKDIREKRVTIYISGYGGYPRINVKDLIDFGTIWSDETKEVIFPVENTGNTDLEVKIRIDSDVFKATTHDLEVPPRETYLLKLLFTPKGKTGTLSASMYIFSNDPLFPVKLVRIVGTSKPIDIVLEGKGCNIFDMRFLGQIILLTYLPLLLLRGIKKNLLNIEIILRVTTLLILLFLTRKEANSSNHLPIPTGRNRTFFLSEADFLTNGSLSISNVLYFSSGQLQRNLYKGDRIIESTDVIRSSVINRISASYMNSENNLLYTSSSFGYFWGENNGFGISDIFFGWKSLIHEEEKTQLFSDVFLSLPIGSERFYLKSVPFAVGALGGLKVDPLYANAGLMYGGREAPIKGVIMGGSIFRLSRTIFTCYEGYISLPFSLKRGFTSSEISASVGFEIDDLIGKVGATKGVIGGFGSADLRVFVSLSANINPSDEPSLRYFEINGTIVDAFGNSISNCIVQVREMLLSKTSPDGRFHLRLPQGTHKIEVLCEGFELSRTYVSRKNNNVKITMEKIQPTIIAYSSDKSGLPLERNIRVGLDDTEFDVQTYYIVLRGERKVKIETEDFSQEFRFSKPEFVWVRIEPPESLKVQAGHHAKTEPEAVRLERGETTQSETGGEHTHSKSDSEKHSHKETADERIRGGQEYREEKKDSEGNIKQDHSEGIQREKIQREDIKQPSIEEDDIVGHPQRSEGEDIPIERIQMLQQKLYDIYTGENNDIVVKFTLANFSINSATIPPHNLKRLQEFIEFVAKNLDNIREIVVEGHTDDLGSDAWNFELSYMRANSVRKYLFERGILVPIKLIGYGSTFPLRKSGDPLSRSSNRRVEIKIYMR